MARMDRRAILHVDMDAFFAAVEVRDRPELAGLPVIVGGASARRGVVAAASYPARAFGIHSAMPTAEAFRRCPAAVLIPARHGVYGAVSERIMAILGQFTPLVEPMSVDEAFLDVTGCEALLGDPVTIARKIKAAIRERERLTASVGVAPNKLTAKIASDLEKPDGLTVVPDEPAAFLAPLPVRRLWGVGPKTAEALLGLGITTIGALAAFDPRRLQRLVGDHAAGLQALARGEDDRPVETGRDAKGLSREETFAEFLRDPGQIDRALLDLAEDVGQRLRADGLRARVVTLKVRDETFATVTRSRTLGEPTDLGEVLHETARALLRDKVDLGGRAIRLLGVGAEGLVPAGAGQLPLLPDRAAEKQRGAAAAVDRIRKKHGDEAVTRAQLLAAPKPPRPARRPSAG